MPPDEDAQIRSGHHAPVAGLSGECGDMVRHVDTLELARHILALDLRLGKQCGLLLCGKINLRLDEVIVLLEKPVR